MNYIQKIVFNIMLLIPTVLMAGWINKSGESLPDTNFRKSIDSFGAQLIFVGNENELFEKWLIPSKTVHLKTIDTVKVNHEINALIVFSGCTKNIHGNCNVTMKYKVLKPDGSIYAQTPPMEVWYDKTAPMYGSLELSADYLKIIIEPTDLLGKYLVVVQVLDYNSGNIIELQNSFTAVVED